MRIAALAALMALLAAPVSAQDPRADVDAELTARLDKQVEGWAKGETEHYVIYGQTGQKIVDQYKINMELLFSEYAKAFKFTGTLPRKARVHIHKDLRGYVAAGGSNSSVAYYSPRMKLLVSYENWELLQFMAHEATHQFFDLAFPTFFKNEAVPHWFSEGIAECFCNCEVRGKTIFINVLDNCENAARSVDILQRCIQKGDVPTVREMLDMSGEEFMQNAGDMYPISWSFCHFLWNAPGRNEGKGQYREVIVRLIEAFKTGANREDAYKAAFVFGKKQLDLDQLDREWRAYIKGLRAKHPPKPKDAPKD